MLKKYVHHKEPNYYNDIEEDVKYPICTCDTNMDVLSRNHDLIFYCKNCGSYYRLYSKQGHTWYLFYDVKTKQTHEDKYED